ncbi:hypothetical protein [Mesorhizobium sp. YR577]|uniref:hypothetical protein n=1 Tax=Mesorhizobium sp. YR577 TaxID=1884373 RepID=UPI0008E78600|nr:hypothetical protein [Mesorhizobium sp. YR577]SFU21040.1 hypothetical protein SAMN05518861_12547 [Mesorhizobium sp. YR577]
MNVTRRSTFAGAAALIATAGAAKAEPAMSPAFQAVADEFTASVAEYRAIDDCMTVLLNSLPEDVLFPVWRPTPKTRQDPAWSGTKFTDSDGVSSYFNRLISSHQNLIDQFGGEADNALVRGHRAEQNRLREYRDEGVAYLQEKSASRKASGLYELDERQEAASERACAAFTALLEYPCQSLDEVHTKARLMLSAPSAYGGELEISEARTLLRSILGAAS